MQRLFVAFVLVVVLLALIAFVFSALTRAVAPAQGERVTDGAETMRKTAFALLVALILYVAFTGLS